VLYVPKLIVALDIRVDSKLVTVIY
jgi:hypothetical protein